MLKHRNRYIAAVASLLMVLVAAGCDDSDTIPPSGSTIVVSGNPTTVVLGTAPECSTLLEESDCGTAEVVATVSNELGLPLPGQDVRFDNTAGLVFLGDVSNPQLISNLPIPTDRFGNARVNLITATTATVNARSGTALGSLTFNTVQGNLNAITLNVDKTPSGCELGLDYESCTQKLCLIATALDTSNAPVGGVVLNFRLQNNVVQGNTFNGTFNPLQPVTDANGEASTVFTPAASCDPECSISLMGGPCGAEIVAETQGGGFQSIPVQLLINIQ